jgi:hypothetical protein
MKALVMKSGEENGWGVDTSTEILTITLNPGKQATYGPMILAVAKFLGEQGETAVVKDLQRVVHEVVADSAMWSKQGKWIGKFERVLEYGGTGD